MYLFGLLGGLKLIHESLRVTSIGIGNNNNNWVTFCLTDIRMEEILYEKLDKRKRDRNNSHETLGQIMVDAGNEFGPGTSYGESFVICM